MVVVNFTRFPAIDKLLPSTPITGVYIYATPLLSTPLLIWHGFHDAIREGDGDRIRENFQWQSILSPSPSRIAS